MTTALGLPFGGDLALYAGGGLGDLVLLAPVIGGLKRARPDCRLVLYCRRPSAVVVQLWPVAPDEVITIDFDPERWEVPDPALMPVLAKLGGTLNRGHAPLLIDVTLRDCWFAPVLGAMLGVAQVVITAPAHDAHGGAMSAAVTGLLGYELPPIIRLGGTPRQHERVRHQAWLAACGVEAGADASWHLTDAADTQARSFLSERGLAPEQYLVCCPGGADATPIKRWPAESFVTVLSRQQMPVVLLGSQAEASLLHQIAGELAGNASVLAGAPDDIALSSGILALARGWLSNDTGPMHLAQAFGRPGVGLFGGGGRWPSYAPWGQGAIGLVRPMPCFGCDWDCLFGHAACLQSIQPEDVLSALDLCLAEPAAPPSIRELASPVGREWSLIAAASDSYQALRREASAHRETLIAVGREAEIQTRAAAERLVLVHQLHDEAARRLDIIQSLVTAVRQPVAAMQISTGLGAGNIGDELMAEAFWQQVPAELRLDVALFPMANMRRAPYPRKHSYSPVDWHGNEHDGAQRPGLLVGGTPVADAEGTHFPLAFIARRLEGFHEAGQPVDAVGVGVETLETAEGRKLFKTIFLPIRSWSVRSEACRQRLLALGCASEAVHVGADWAWLFRPRRDLRGWAEVQWRSLGLRPGEPLVLVNAVHMNWQHCNNARQALAQALNKLARQGGYRIGLFCNEVREGEFFDNAAARALAAYLEREPIFVPNLYWAPDEAVALTGRAELTLGQRYHFALQSVLAGTLPVTIPRGDKQRDLAVDAGIRLAGSIEDVDAGLLLAALEEELNGRVARLAALAERRRQMEWRAAGNLDLLRTLEPYSSLFAGASGPFSA